jgi:hypothetical protein
MKPISVLYKYEGWGEGQGRDTYTSPRETLAVASSRPNSESLAARVVLAHPRVTFHPCTCGFCRGAATVAAALIGYDDMEVVAGTATMRR